MSKVKFARRVDFLVTMTFSKKEGQIYQTYKFWTSNKKYLKYANDQRFCLKKKLDKIFDDHVLPIRLAVFLSKDYGENEVVFRYEDLGDFKMRPAQTFNCEFYMPPFNGCAYCTKCKQQGDYLYCTEKKKHYDSKGIKTCPIFQSIDEIIS